MHIKKLRWISLKKKNKKQTARKTTGQISISFFWWMQKPLSLEETMLFVGIIYCTIGSIHILNSNSNKNSNPTRKKNFPGDRINACLLKETTVFVLLYKSALKLYALTSKYGLIYVWGCMLFYATHTHKKRHNIHGDSSNLYALS